MEKYIYLSCTQKKNAKQEKDLYVTNGTKAKELGTLSEGCIHAMVR
jgi:hypothetical protein